ncbi:helix-turn-helix transcriptional regulator [Aquabacterium sp.]|uniref:helix-turn-helix transcriptional regulator n=1 Tax=Aquabacterium sp. TaxID=1872578 RepID=UPI002BF9CA44|nr:helix-turn-helix transcriptional regulator [Aquabacterium sp.]HSW07298.1 helix-turn-helix transcriptional regulator [Aquabacterium sp.]
MTPDGLLLDLYASAAEPTRWSSTLDRLCAETGAYSAVVQAFSFDGARAQIHWSAQDSQTRKRHALSSAGISDSGNPRLDPQRALRGLNRIAGDDELFDPGDIARPRLQQQLATLGLGQFIGSLQEVSRGHYLGLALHRAVEDRRVFSAPQIERVASLAPHIGQAFVLADRLQTRRVLDERLRQHFDQLRCALIVCDAGGHAQWFNRSAEALLCEPGSLHLSPAGLRARTHAETEAFLREVAAAAVDREGRVHYLNVGRGAAALHVAAQAVNLATPHCVGEPTVMLVITPVSAIGEIPAAALAKLFGLTQAEARLVGAMVTGSTVEQYAQHRGISVGTARGQLKQVQSKTGARRQSELVRLVLSSAAAQLLAPG